MGDRIKHQKGIYTAEQMDLAYQQGYNAFMMGCHNQIVEKMIKEAKKDGK